MDWKLGEQIRISSVFLFLPSSLDFGASLSRFGNIHTGNIKNKEVAIRHLSFPGISLYLDGQKKEINTDQLGRIKLTIPKGIHTITVKFEETPLIKVSKLITIASTFILFFVAKKAYAKEKKT